MRWLLAVVAGCEGAPVETQKPTGDTGPALAVDTAAPAPLCPWEGSWTAAVECGAYDLDLVGMMEIVSLDGAPDECGLTHTQPEANGAHMVESLTIDVDVMTARSVGLEVDGEPEDPPYVRELGRVTVEPEGEGYALTFETMLWGAGCIVAPVVRLTP